MKQIFILSIHRKILEPNCLLGGLNIFHYIYGIRFVGHIRFSHSSSNRMCFKITEKSLSSTTFKHY